MTASKTNSKSAKNVFMPAKASVAYNAALRGMRQIVSRTTGAINYVLMFDEAEVVMPGSWVIRDNEFPEGLYEGIKLDAYWEPDESGIDRFHLVNRD